VQISVDTKICVDTPILEEFLILKRHMRVEAAYRRRRSTSSVLGQLSDWGVRIEKDGCWPSKAQFPHVSTGAVRRPARARRFGLVESTVRAIYLRRRLEPLAASRRRRARQMGLDETHPSKKQKSLAAGCNLDAGEPLWLGRERKKETLDEFFREQLSRRQRHGT
jgi:hypothetical protein